MMELYIDRNVLTPIQLKIMERLADGRRHWVRELIPLLDELASKRNVGMHIRRIRPLLRPLGHDIVCVCEGRKTFYQHVILLPSIND